MMYDTAIYIGRFQPVHNGHIALLRHALAHAHRVIVVIGSAWQARSPKNPFTWQEREAMLRNALPASDRTRLHILPMRDYYNDALWVDAVRQGVAQRAAESGHMGVVGLVGHFKDATSSYLNDFPDWVLMPLERQGDIDATAIRNTYFGASQGPETLTDKIPASTLDFLQDFAQQTTTAPLYAALQEEWQMLRGYRQAWANAPYSPVFVTVDAVVRCQNHILLIRRAHAPGKGQRAVPGGFIEQHETLWQSCVRELAEETHCHLPEATLRTAWKQTAVFDHPQRSQRGRTITHAHYFDLGDMPFPSVQADDDAAQVEWIPIDQLAALETEFYEDHFYLLDYFMGLSS